MVPSVHRFRAGKRLPRALQGFQSRPGLRDHTGTTPRKRISPRLPGKARQTDCACQSKGPESPNPCSGPYGRCSRGLRGTYVPAELDPVTRLRPGPLAHHEVVFRPMLSPILSPSGGAATRALPGDNQPRPPKRSVGVLQWSIDALGIAVAPLLAPWPPGQQAATPAEYRPALPVPRTMSLHSSIGADTRLGGGRLDRQETAGTADKEPLEH